MKTGPEIRIDGLPAGLAVMYLLMLDLDRDHGT